MDDAVLSQTRGILEHMRAALPAKGRVFILPHDYPDPDALASAAAMELLLTHYFNLRGQIVFTGMVSRAENKELLRHFRYKCRTPNQVRVSGKRVPSIFVDVAPWSRNVTVPAFVKPAVVVDHHPQRGGQAAARKGLFTDIRSGRGATASIMTEYLVAAGLAIPKWLASILVYAIATETLDLSVESTRRDLDAYFSVLTRADFGLVGRIRHAPLVRRYYSRLREAMQNAYTYGQVAWTHLDSAEQPEIVAEIADLLLRMERITWSFCTGYIEDRLVISLRSSRESARCGRLLIQQIGANGAGGGHHRMAAGYLALDKLSGPEREARREMLVRGLLAKIVRRTIPANEPLALIAQPLTQS